MRIFSGEGGTGLVTTDCFAREDAEDAAEEEFVVAEFILTLAPSAFTRFGIFSRLTTGTGPLENKIVHTTGHYLIVAVSRNLYISLAN